MKAYRNAFTTFDDVVRQFYIDNAGFSGLASVQAVEAIANTNATVYLKELLFDVSSAIRTQIGRTLVPYVETVNYGKDYLDLYCWFDRRVNAYRLNLDEDLLSVTSVTQPSGLMTSGTDYRLNTAHRSPNQSLLFASYPALSDFDDTLDIIGTWGYHENTAQMWTSIGTLQANITDSATTFVATSETVTAFETYSYIKIDSEYMFVTSVVTGSPYTITVERGVNGTTAVAHTSTTAISKFIPMPNVAQETRRLVIRAYNLRDASNNVYVSGEEVRELVETEFKLNIPARVTFGVA